MVTPAKETGLLSSSPVDGNPSKKRTRSALQSLNLNDGSPEKRDTPKPPRKVSKASVSSSKSDKENAPEAAEDQESMLVDV